MASDLHTRVRLPAGARRGEIVEIRVLVQHAMESGQRRDATGALVPRKILNALTIRYAGRDVLTAKLEPAMSANPLFTFSLRAETSGDVELIWTDDDGSVHRSAHKLVVSG